MFEHLAPAARKAPAGPGPWVRRLPAARPRPHPWTDIAASRWRPRQRPQGCACRQSL